MAPRQLQRNYSLGGEFFDVPIRRTPSLKRPLETSGSPQTFTLQAASEASSEDEDASIFGMDGNGREPVPLEQIEPVLDDGQIEALSTDSARPTISMETRRRPGFAPSTTSDSVLSRDIGSSMDTNRKTALASSATSASVLSQDTGTRRSTTIFANKLPDFFSKTVFETVLANPTISHQLLKYSQTRMCGENMEFLARITRYHALLNDVSKALYEINKDFISSRAPDQINITEPALLKVNRETKMALGTTLPMMEGVFTEAELDVERLVYGDVYPNFVRHQMSLSAARALGRDVRKYAGLGDCFVLTDPTKADNPIVFASDGFVKVTGYTRGEIIPRNCRFLQGQHTDQSSVKRLKNAIATNRESVELLLNLKKDGTPFWNLLYTTPLFSQGAQGHERQPVFFLGGQINCSSTIHSQSDVLRILAQSKDEDQSAQKPAQPQPLSKKTSFLNAFRPSQRAALPPKPAGMENTLLNRMEEAPLENQISTFYNAYSNYIVINYSTFLISFISNGLLDMLFPIKAKAGQTNAVGMDCFRFLSNHGSGTTSWEFKSAVKGALKAGNAVTLDYKLVARPMMGFETFALHWTPLKDELGAVGWIVLTLGNERRVGLAM